MPPLTYHAGQLAIQEEAKSANVAARLAHWIGPVADFARQADLLLLALVDEAGRLRFTVLSGKAPLLTVSGESTPGMRYPAGDGATDELRLRFAPEVAPPIAAPTRCGGLAINYATARRARINGTLLPTVQSSDAGSEPSSEQGSENGSELVTSETFTLCRKYIAPSLPTGHTPQRGPLAREPIALGDPWLQGLVSQSESFFLATISPEGGPDVAHRGGPAGFLQLDAATRRLAWHEFVGDGVFKSAGNVRATGLVTILIPDFAGGDGVELVGTATYCNLRGGRQQRSSALEQHSEDFPLQGVIECEIQQAQALRQLLSPRRPVMAEGRITSRATVEVQAPQ